jgi:LuxR family transcriptional regulator, maltose regulon positive regulatory protein
MMLDGQAQTIRALLRAFPPGTDHSELALVRAMGAAARRSRWPNGMAGAPNG